MELTDDPVNQVHKELWEILVQLVLLVHQGNKDHEDTPEKLVMPVHEVLMVCPVNLDHPVQWDLLVHQVFQVALDPREKWDLMETKVLKVHRDPEEKMVKLDQPVTLVFQVLPV
jgi:hypothetical protein